MTKSRESGCKRDRNPLLWSFVRMNKATNEELIFFVLTCFFREIFVFTKLKMDVPSVPQIKVEGTCVLEEAECGAEVDLPTDDHLMNLKALTEKLRLETRRPSYLEWKAQLEATSFGEPVTGKFLIGVEPAGEAAPPKETVVNSDVFQCKLPSGVLKGFGNIDEALRWLRRELVRHGLNYKYKFIIYHCTVEVYNTFCIAVIFCSALGWPHFNWVLKGSSAHFQLNFKFISFIILQLKIRIENNFLLLS